MEKLNKIVKKLSDESFELLINEVSKGRENKPFQVLKNARENDLSDEEMRLLLDVNHSTYYTLKSRLNQKIANILLKDVDNPISSLLNEVNKVPAYLYGANRSVTIKVLKDLEKRLLQYDLSNELIVVYKALSRINRNNSDFDHYEKLYKKNVAFSLSVTKAEDLFYNAIGKFGVFKMTHSEADLESIRATRRELSNINDLYQSHRLNVFYNVTRLYYLFNAPHKRQSIAEHAEEIKDKIDAIAKVVETYHLDTFYKNLRHIVDLLYFDFHALNNDSLADYYFKRVLKNLPEIASKHLMSFFLAQFINAVLKLSVTRNNLEMAILLNEKLKNLFDEDVNEVYNYVTYKRLNSVIRFYNGDYQLSAKAINDVRTHVNLKNYRYVDVECKLFQALQYCLVGENELCNQIINTVKRQVDETDFFFLPVFYFIKMMKASMKTSEFRLKLKRVGQYYESFISERNKAYPTFMWFLTLTDKQLRQLSNPIKS